ncbi:MAG: hypothetical protein JO264_00225 [Acidisphaera sp.]|nr:hypothetical protein [Acidisphaera sp.]
MIDDTRHAAGPLAQSVGLAFRMLHVVVLLLAGGWAISNIREVPADSRAVVLRFGRVERVQAAGLVLAWPRPIEQIVLLPAWDRQIPLAIETPSNAGPTAETAFQLRQPDDVVDVRAQKDAWNGQYFLTGDGSVVQCDGTLFFRITDPAAYVLAQSHVAPALQRLYRASAVAIAAGSDLDDFLVARPEQSAGRPDAAARREALRGVLAAAINRRLQELREQGGNLGVEVSRIDFVALLPPLAKAAFDEVLTATQIADQTAAAARTDAANAAQEADRTGDRIRSEAGAAAEEQIRRASADIADVAALHARITPATRASVLAEYYRERIGPTLRNAGQVTAVDLQGGQHLILPGPTP